MHLPASNRRPEKPVTKTKTPTPHNNTTAGHHRSSRVSALLGGLLVILLSSLALCASASAASIHRFAFSFSGSETPAKSLENPNGIAIDQITGDIYVADIGHNVIDRFNATGKYISQITGAETPTKGFSLANPAAIAVDDSTNALDASAGDLYVLDRGNSAISRFGPNGEYLGQLTGTPEGPFTPELEGLSVDTEGNLWVYDSNSRISEFDFTGAPATGFATPFGAGPGFAVNANDQVYAARGNGSLEKYDTPAKAFAKLGRVDQGHGDAVAIDPSSGAVFVDDGSHIAAYGASAVGSEAEPPNPLDSFGSEQLTDSEQGGVAVNPATGVVYVANPSDGKVYTYEALPVPDVTTEAASNLTGTTATIAGSLNPLGLDATWRFEYGTTNSYGSFAPTTPVDAGSGSSPLPVSTALTGLEPDTLYHYRLVASTVNGTAVGADATFTTPAAPTVSAIASTSEVSETAATLHGTVTPNLADTTYHIDYGTTTGYGQHVPASDADLGASATAQEISQALGGLAPDTTYHYRVVASNLVGTTTGQDHIFTTAAPVTPASPSALPGRGFLPDNRGWELVSPPNKNGAEVMGDSARTRAAADGSAATFSSLEAFGDVRGTSDANEYMSIRSTNPEPGNNGWSTHAITPAQEPGTLRGALQALEPMWEGEMSANLERGVFRAWSPLTQAPAVANVQNLYVRNDLRTSGAGTYALATDCLVCGETPLPSLQTVQTRPWLTGASADFTHVVYESSLPLLPGSTGDSAGNYNVYEWEAGTLRLASLVPPPGDTTCGPDGPACVPAASAVSGRGGSREVYTPHVISEDGSHVFFTDTSEDPGGAAGRLYVRINHSTTVQLNASERTDCADHDPCAGAPEPDPAGPQPAEWQTASSDGTRAFFVTREQLVNSDTDDQPDLYMYDEDAPEGHHLTRISVDSSTGAGLRGGGVLGISSDGHWVYFLAGGGDDLYVWHDGTTSMIGHLSSIDTDGPNDWNLAPVQSRVTPDGHELLFGSVSETLTGQDPGHACATYLNQGSGPCQQLYLYNAVKQSLVCVSCDPSGGPSTANARLDVRAGQGGALTTWHLPHALSDDGSEVFFNTRAALVPSDSNGKIDPYEWRADGVDGCALERGCLALLSSGTDTSDSYFMDASANGSNVFILTRQQLVGWDIDQNYDLYDARVDGGFPEPPSQSPACAGDDCQGPAAVAPALLAPGSASISGAGNLVPAPKVAPSHRSVVCKRGFVKRRVKHRLGCVRKRPVVKHVKSTRHVARKEVAR
jgi:hypothetical protein